MPSAFSAGKTVYFEKNQKILDIKLGEPAATARAAMGEPVINTEKFSSVTYEVWEYSQMDGKPLAFLTVDPKAKKIVSRSIWVYEHDPEHELDKLLKEYFNQNQFEKYIPCQGRGLEEVLVDKVKGIFIATRDGKTTIVSWSDPVLTKLRIEQFYEKCPKLQPSRK
jgi:hypothetical protein